MQFRPGTWQAKALVPAQLAPGRGLSLRCALVLLVILTLAFMAVAMASNMAPAHAAPVPAIPAEHCAGQHETQHGKHPDSAQACAMACAIVEPMAPRLAVRAAPARSLIAPQPTRRLDGIAPSATSPPPRLFS